MPTDTPLPVIRDVPATVARLFEQGKKWTFATKVRTFRFDHDSTPPKTIEATQEGTLVCEVTASTATPNRRDSKLTCKATPPFPEDPTFPMEFAATKAGLWRAFDGSALGPESKLLDEPPKLRRTESTITEGGSVFAVTSESPGRWCSVYQGGGMGQAGGTMLCLRGGDFVGGQVDYELQGSNGITISWGEHDEFRP